MEIPECFYRVSIKALVLNETRDKFLIVQELNGWWELPGGGLDWGMTPQEDLSREIDEEMELKTDYIASNPSYFFTFQSRQNDVWIANVVYEAQLESLDFSPSEECVDIKFVNKDSAPEQQLTQNVITLLALFDHKKHTR